MNPEQRNELVQAFEGLSAGINRVVGEISTQVIPVFDRMRQEMERTAAALLRPPSEPAPSPSEQVALAARRERLRTRESSSRPQVRLTTPPAIERGSERP